ncbi:MAG: hypothetical protein GY703_02935, partial [Gammaproteobacteria bacterium]|nr:hypothetical protein [Gammaproteobacteria bacterium]
LRNVQRLLEPVDVVNPWADQLTFTAERTRTRRDHEKYLTMIDSIALLHQHQRPRESCPVDGGRFLTVTLEDIELANRLAPELLSRSLDELPPQSRRLLNCIKELVKDLCRREDMEQSTAFFSRRQLCESSGWTYSQVKRHLDRLQELEYVVTRYGRMGSTLRYELLVDVDLEDAACPIGLLDVGKLRKSIPAIPTLTPSPETLTPLCQNDLARLSTSKKGTKDNLATFSDRTSGALKKVVVT